MEDFIRVAGDGSLELWRMTTVSLCGEDSLARVYKAPCSFTSFHSPSNRQGAVGLP